MPLVECMSTGAGLAKRFIARNKLFPVIVSYYKTLVPLFFRSVLGTWIRLFIYASTDFTCFTPFSILSI